MQQEIKVILSEIEKTNDVKILLAVESGSRAWGFASRDSDYDVRFIYLHKPEWYLTILPGRDVIEMKQDELLDFSGWDLKKTLHLFGKLNPPLMEWLDSSIIYHEYSTIPAKLRELKQTYFSPRSAVCHYLHMAEGNYRGYLKHDEVKLKKYFYVLRPLMACMWVEHFRSHPPIQFRKLLDFCSEKCSGVCDEIELLLERKIAGDELDLAPRINVLNNFIEQKISYYNSYASKIDACKLPESNTLDSVLLEALNEVYGDRFLNSRK
jgi:uncharacterized protein